MNNMGKIFKFILNIILWIWENIIYEFFYEIGLIIRNNWKNILKGIGIILLVIIGLIFFKFTATIFVWLFFLSIWIILIGSMVMDLYNKYTDYPLLQNIIFGIIILVSLGVIIFVCTKLTIKIFS
jgi:hypothetical protein